MADNATTATGTPAANTQATAADPAVTNDTEDLIEGQEAEEGKEAAADPAKAEADKKAEKKEEKKSSKRRYNIKVDKSEEEVEFDPDNEEEVVKHLQMSRAAQKRMAESAELRKMAMQFVNDLKTDPRKVLSDPSLGVDIKKLAQDILNDEIKELEKSPEQREREKLQRELEDLRKQAKDKEEAFKRAEFERIQVEQEKFLEAEISAALDVGGVPKTPKTVARMAEMMMIALQRGIDLGPKDIIHVVKNNTMSEFKEIISALSDDQLDEFLGKEVLGRLRKKNQAKAKAVVQTATQVKQTGQQEQAQQKAKENAKEEEKITYRKFFGI